MAAIILRNRAKCFSHNSLFKQRKLLFNVRNYAEVSSKNLYETLGVASTATLNDIKNAYYDLTMKFHPDRSKNNPVAAEKFREVSEAYAVLSNYVLKKKYDMGVPLSTVMKTVKRAPIDHKVKYQTFYDSRAVQPPPKQFIIGEDKEEVSKQTKWVKEMLEYDNELRKKNGTVQIVLIIYISVLLMTLSKGNSSGKK